MGRRAPSVFTAPADVARIEDLVTRLPSQARVRVTMRSGHIVDGTVTERPATQLFEDDAGHEGFNAVVRLDDPASPPWTVYLWLSDIAAVEHLDNT